MLIGVSGVGPKAALAILSSNTPEGLAITSSKESPSRSIPFRATAISLWLYPSTAKAADASLALFLGKAAKLYTHLYVREEIFELYGFASESELGCFRMLIGENCRFPFGAGEGNRTPVFSLGS